MSDFYKKFVFLSKNCFSSNKVIQNKYLYPLSKNLNLLKRNSLCKNIHDEFYFQISFATNEQV